MRESTFELASRLRAEAEALEELFLEGEQGHSYQARLEEEGRLEELLSLAQDRLANIRLQALQDNLEDVEAMLGDLKADEDRRKKEGRQVALVESFIQIAEAERRRLHQIISAAVRAEEETRKVRQQLRARTRAAIRAEAQRKPRPPEDARKKVRPTKKPAKRTEIVDTA
ncbi:MAG: hypothetical protein HY319_11905 [Armatimonadetes bacterium]|nr:hypothetical protein [Armatimonadota bacterium]